MRVGCARGAWLFLGFLVLGCGSASSPTTIADGGSVREDGGAVLADGGTPADGGAAADGGAPFDGGASMDGGPASDAGTPDGSACRSGIGCTLPGNPPCKFGRTSCRTGVETCEAFNHSDGLACEDGNGCTRRDQCQAGECIGFDPVVCAVDTQCEQSASCDPATGECVAVPKQDGTMCDDGVTCTSGETCSGGRCVGAADPGCPVYLEFLAPPRDALVGAPFASPVEVAAKDASGATVSGATTTIALSLAPNAGGAALAGTTSASLSGGVATFSDVRVEAAGLGLRLVASATGLRSAESLPFDVTGWASIGPFGADVRALLLVPGAPSRLYAGTHSGEVFVSSDGAVTWSPLHFPGPSVWTLSADPVSPGVIWAGTSPGGAYRSSDGGRSWERRGLVGKTLYQMAIHPTDPRTLYAGTIEGVYKSTNAGATWTLASGDLTRQTFTLVLDPAEPDTLYAGTNGAGVLKSTNGGISWTAANNGLAGLRVEWLVLDPTAPGTLYTIAGVGIYKTTDGAATWMGANSGITGAGGGLFLAQAPSDPATLYLGTASGEVFRTTNGAGSWTRLVQGLPRSQSPSRFITVWALAVDPADAGVVYAGLGDNAGVFRTTTGGTMWSDANQGLSGLVPQALAVDPNDPARILVSAFVGQHGETFLSTNAGITWATVASLRDRHVAQFHFDSLDPAIVYAATNLGVRRSLDGGETWATAGIELTGGVNQLASEVTAGWVYAATTEGIFRSSDEGDTWDNITGTMGGDFPWADAVAAGTTTAGRLYVAMTTTGVHRSDDGGESWTSAATLPSLVVSLAVDPANDDVVYAGVLNNGLFKSQNAGAGWAPARTGLPSPGTADVLAIAPARPLRIYLGTSTKGLFVSDDAAGSWDPAGVGLYKNFVRGIAPHPEDADTVYAAIVGRSVLRSNRGAK